MRLSPPCQPMLRNQHKPALCWSKPRGLLSLRQRAPPCASTYSRSTPTARVCTNEDNSDPSWSPDGKEIAFSSNRDGSYELYVINRDGSNPRQLTHGFLIGAHHPSWSPDGRQIAFSTGQEGEICIMDANGANVRVLTKVGWYPAFGKVPAP